ncbi:10965_t:CDS:1, partial [Gigaspora margarita]
KPHVWNFLHKFVKDNSEMASNKALVIISKKIKVSQSNLE